MTQGFDEFFKENFEDGLSDPSKYILKFTFEAGAQSRQAEIDELQSKLETAEKNLNNAFKTIKFEQHHQEELQNRIDDALKALEKLDGYDYNENLDAVFLILKGEEND